MNMYTLKENVVEILASIATLGVQHCVERFCSEDNLSQEPRISEEIATLQAICKVLQTVLKTQKIK